MKDGEDAALSQLREAFPVGTPSAGMPLDDACLLRYLRARDGSIPKATAMLNATLQWRREFEVDKVRGSMSLYLVPGRMCVRG